MCKEQYGEKCILMVHLKMLGRVKIHQIDRKTLFALECAFFLGVFSIVCTMQR